MNVLAPPANPRRAQFESLSVPVLKVQEFPKRLWDLKATLRFWSAELQMWLDTPEEFRTDGCSVPRAPFVYLLAGGKAEEAGYTHDGLYTSKRFPRPVCDRVLREAVVAMGYAHELAEAMYLAVVELGQSHWDLQNVPQVPSVQAWMASVRGVD